jgi:hypothetical protein
VGGLARNFPALCKALLPFVFGFRPAPLGRSSVAIYFQFPFGNRIHWNILVLSLSGHDTNQPKFRYNNGNLRIC